MCLNHGTLAGALLFVTLLSCLPVEPPFTNKPGKPVVRFGGMAVVRDTIEGYHEGVHISWTLAQKEPARIRSFTLMRKFPADSVFDVFGGSRGIPADTADFYDVLAGHTFPEEGFDSVYYRLCAVDDEGRTGDTSEACVVTLAPQARLVGFDPKNGCLLWESWIRGGIFSWCSVWDATMAYEWASQRQDAFPHTDQPGSFSACFPDSLQPPPPGRWYFALFVRANDTYSLKIGSIDVE